MTEGHLDFLRKAIMDYNSGFLERKEMNRQLYTSVFKIPERRNEERERLKSEKPLLAEIKELIEEIEEKKGINESRNYYNFTEGVEESDLLAPATGLEGYLIEAMRVYFVHKLKIVRKKPNYMMHFDQYFDFCLDDFLQEKSLIESMEVKHTVDWAIIGRALAVKEIERLTKKRGRRKKSDDNSSLLDEKRAHFADGVYSNLYTMELAGEFEGIDFITDQKIVSTYQSLLTYSLSKADNVMDELEDHIKIKNIGNEGACNSISRGREY